MDGTYIWKREFLAMPDAALQSTECGPVYIALAGRPTHVILNYEDYAAMIRLARLPDLRMDELMISIPDGESIEVSAQGT